MDNKTFAQFTELCIQRAQQDKTLSDTNPNEIAQIFRQLRTKPETITYSFTNRDNYDRTSINFITVCYWVPFCIAKVILYPFIAIILIGFLSITVLISCLPGPGVCGHSTTLINLQCGNIPNKEENQ